MSAQERLQGYLERARQYEQLGQTLYRDRCLELAIYTAWQAGKVSEGERLWRRLRQLNPHLYLCGFPSLPEAMQRPEVQQYLESAQSNAAEWLDRSVTLGPSLTAPGSTTAGELNLPLDTSLMRDSGRLTTTPDPTARDTSAREKPHDFALERSGSENATKDSAVPVRASAAAIPSGRQPARSPAREQPGACLVPRPSRSQPAREDRPEVTLPERASIWVAGSLAVLLALLGLLLAAYILLAPFLPDSFLR